MADQEKPTFLPHEYIQPFKAVAKPVPDVPGEWEVQFLPEMGAGMTSTATFRGVSAQQDAEAFAILQNTKNVSDIVMELVTYHAPSQGDVEKISIIRFAAAKMIQAIIDNCPPSADRSAAIRKVREGLMTANASIVLAGFSIQ